MDLDLSTRRERLLKHRSVIEEFGTPLYVFFEEDIRRNYRELRSALDEHYPDSEIHFAAKANFIVDVLSILQDEGCGAEAFANCELTATLEAGFDPEDILLTGMYRPQAEIERAMDEGVTHFLLDNAAEFERVAAAAENAGTRAHVLLRGNPAMEVPTDPDIATATRESKFGLDIESGRAMSVAERVVESEHLVLAGVQLHIGSQIEHAEPYAVAAQEMLEFAAAIRDKTDVEIDILDLGGGFPVPYDGSVPSTCEIVEDIGNAIRNKCQKLDFSMPTLFLEPGRRLVGNAGALCGSVGLVKETPASTFVILDAGTNAVSSYWPYPIYSLAESPTDETYDVAGPLCYTGDVIQKAVSLPVVQQGDVIVVDRIGAYSLGSASNTNAEPKPPVVIVNEDGTTDIARERETCNDVLDI